jgi:hypothetical protein
MAAILSSETSVLTRATRRHIPEDDILHSHHSDNFKSYIFLKFTPQQLEPISWCSFTCLLTKQLCLICVVEREHDRLRYANHVLTNIVSDQSPSPNVPKGQVFVSTKAWRTLYLHIVMRGTTSLPSIKRAEGTQRSLYHD